MSFVSFTSPEVSPAILQALLHLIAARTGLYIRDKDQGELSKVLLSRLKTLKIEQPQEYLRLLETQNGVFDSEWTHLMPRLTNGESYFWRDKGQFALLKNRILPELIAARSATRHLRLWSAGCSTGEEPYSLAILLDEILPKREGWNLFILGTDINQESLNKARHATYGDWAFRGFDSAMQKRYFERMPHGFRLNDRLRSMVTFAPLNLRGDDYPSIAQGIADFDLILCRNVLIYFDKAAIAHVLSGFARSLREDGYLLTGHAELANQDPSPLRARVFAESVAYQRGGSSTTGPFPMTSVVSQTSAVSVPAAPRPLLPVAPQKVVPQKPPVKKIEAVLPIIKTAVSSTVAPAPAKGGTARDALLQKARRCADLGDSQEAARLCQEVIQLDSTDAEAYFLWAQVETEREEHDHAKSLLRKVLYLSPNHFDAHLELGALYAAENDAARARRERLAALQLLRALPAQQALEHHGEATVGELIQHLTALTEAPQKSDARGER